MKKKLTKKKNSNKRRKKPVNKEEKIFNSIEKAPALSKKDMNVSRSEGIDEIKRMIEQTDHILKIERKKDEDENTIK